MQREQYLPMSVYLLVVMGKLKDCSQGPAPCCRPIPKRPSSKLMALHARPPEDSLPCCCPCLCSHLPRGVGGYVNPSFCGIEPEDSQVSMRTVSQEHRHRPIQGHGVVQLILEYIQIVEAIRLPTPAGRQAQTSPRPWYTQPPPHTHS